MSISTFNNHTYNIQLKFNNTSTYMTILVIIVAGGATAEALYRASWCEVLCVGKSFWI